MGLLLALDSSCCDQKANTVTLVSMTCVFTLLSCPAVTFSHFYFSFSGFHLQRLFGDVFLWYLWGVPDGARTGRHGAVTENLVSEFGVVPRCICIYTYLYYGQHGTIQTPTYNSFFSLFV